MTSPPKPRPRILFVLPATAIGGAERRFQFIMEQLEGFEISLLTHRAIVDLFDANRFQIACFDDEGLHAPMPMNPRAIFTYGGAIRTMVRKTRPALIFGIMHVGTLYSAFARDLMGGPKPALIGSILGNVSAYFERFGRKPSLYEQAILRYMVQRPERVIVSSRGVRDDLIDRFGGSSKRIQVIGNGIDLLNIRAYRSARDNPPGRDRRFRIITTCRLNAQKDVATLILAIHRLKERGVSASLEIIGDGEERSMLESLTQQLGITDRVLFHGALRSPYLKMAEADLFVLSSFFEGFGNVLIEAMALGLPVISTDCPSGPSEIIQHHENGLLVPMQDPEALASAIVLLIEEPALRARLIEQADLRLERHDASHMTAAYQTLIETWVKQRNPEVS